MTRAYLRGLRRSTTSVAAQAESLDPGIRGLNGELTAVAELPASPLASVAGEASGVDNEIPLVDATSPAARRASRR